MGRIASRGRPLRRVAGAALSVSLVGAFVFQGGSALGASSCATPPNVYPESSLHAGLTAVGYTVILGTTPTSFNVKILGVQPNGIAPGLDFILAQITGPPSFLAQT